MNGAYGEQVKRPSERSECRRMHFSEMAACGRGSCRLAPQLTLSLLCESLVWVDHGHIYGGII